MEVFFDDGHQLKSSASGRYNDDCFNEVRHRQDDNKAALVQSSQHMICAIGSINSHYFHIIGDKLINPIVGVYIPIIRISY